MRRGSSYSEVASKNSIKAVLWMIKLNDPLRQSFSAYVGFGSVVPGSPEPLRIPNFPGQGHPLIVESYRTREVGHDLIVLCVQVTPFLVISCTILFHPSLSQ
jgi:hypothetical protein